MGVVCRFVTHPSRVPLSMKSHPRGTDPGTAERQLWVQSTQPHGQPPPHGSDNGGC
jgi:hypothetical protein